MAYSGWRFSCDRGTLERCAGALEIHGEGLRERFDACANPDDADALRIKRAYALGAAAALRAIVADGDGIEPTEFVGQVMSRMNMGVER